MQDKRIPLEIAYTDCNPGLDETGDVIDEMKTCEYFQADDNGDCKFSDEMCLSAGRNLSAIRSDMTEMNAQYREIESVFQERESDETE